MRDQKWKEAVPVLQTMLQRSWTPEQREQTVVWLAQSYIESDQGAKVVELLPDMLTKAPKARLSIDFNHGSAERRRQNVLGAAGCAGAAFL